MSGSINDTKMVKSRMHEKGFADCDEQEFEEKMSKLPDDWLEVKIEDIGIVDSGQGAPQGDSWYKGDKIFIKAGDLNNLTEGKYVGDYCQRISEEAINHHGLKEYPANSIVFPKSGMSVKTDNIALLKYDSYVVNHLAIVKVKEELCFAKYLYYLFKWVKISNFSTSLKNLSKSLISNTPQ